MGKVNWGKNQDLSKVQKTIRMLIEGLGGI